MVVANMEEGFIQENTWIDVVTESKAMKPGKAAGPSEVCAEDILSSGKVGISAMV